MIDPYPAPGMTCQIYDPAIQERPLAGAITFVDPGATPDTPTVGIVAHLLNGDHAVYKFRGQGGPAPDPSWSYIPTDAPTLRLYTQQADGTYAPVQQAAYATIGWEPRDAQ